MKKKITFSLLSILFSISAFTQEYNFNIHNTTLKEYIKIEESLGNKKIATEANHISLTGDAQPIKYQQSQKTIPDLITYYFFNENDSTISYILYEWDTRHSKTKENSYDKESEELNRALIAKYYELEKILSIQFGSPTTVTGDLSDFNKVNQKGGLQKKNYWFPNDSTEVEMYTTISNYYEKKGAIIIQPTHRIRLYIKRKKIETVPTTYKLEKKRLERLYKTTLSFFILLKKEKHSRSRTYLSEQIIDQITDEQLDQLAKTIDLNRKIELFFSGTQVEFNKKVLTVLQFKYSDDFGFPPQEIIKVIYDEKDQIISILPIKLSYIK